MPRFSIIVPFYNATSTIAATIESLQNQSCPDWEAIFVNDGSTDGSEKIVARFLAADPRIKLCTNTGKGPSDARNYAARIATGDYLSFCDADDLWTAHRLAELEAVFWGTKVQGLYGRIAFFRDEPGDGTTQSTVLPNDLRIRDLLGENPVCTMSNLTVQASAFRKCGGLDPNIVHNEDLEFLIRFIGSGNSIWGVDSLHVWYRTTPTGLSSNLAAMLNGRRQAVARARTYGTVSTPAQEAIYMRYLARRALRLDSGALSALRFAAIGLWQNPMAFLCPLRRGGLTAIACMIAPALPRRIRQSLFSS